MAGTTAERAISEYRSANDHELYPAVPALLVACYRHTPLCLSEEVAFVESRVALTAVVRVAHILTNSWRCVSNRQGSEWLLSLCGVAGSCGVNSPPFSILQRFR